MPNNKQAIKRMRTSVAAAGRNKSRKSAMWTYEKQFMKALASGDLEAAKKAMFKVFSVSDKAAKHNVVHKNRVARKKSRLTAALRRAEAAAAAPAAG